MKRTVVSSTPKPTFNNYEEWKADFFPIIRNELEDASDYVTELQNEIKIQKSRVQKKLQSTAVPA
jgi:hypothetical protein